MHQDETHLAGFTTVKRFRTILADPPWDREQKSGHGAHRHYPLMTVQQITAMPVSDLATENAHLWLWAASTTGWRTYLFEVGK
jgi:N6-adenosine-specific RNA methylase IME4